jgi:L-fuconate dehydratase
VTSAGWLGMFPFSLCSLHNSAVLTLFRIHSGYSDEKIAKLTKDALNQGFNHFKMKVGADREDDLRRGKLIRSIIDDPANIPSPRFSTQSDENALEKRKEEQRKLEKEALKGKNPGPTGNVLMIDANQVWDVEEAVEWVKGLTDIKPWWAMDKFTTLLFV